MKITKAHGVPLAVLAAAMAQASFAAGVANPDSHTMVQGTASVTLDVLANDTSDTDTPLHIGEYDTISSAKGSIIVTNDNKLLYTPTDSTFVGDDTFSYQAVDDTGYGSIATVTIHVVANNGEGVVESQVTGDSNKRTARMLDTVCAKSTAQGGDGSGLSHE